MYVNPPHPLGVLFTQFVPLYSRTCQELGDVIDVSVSQDKVALHATLSTYALVVSCVDNVGVHHVLRGVVENVFVPPIVCVPVSLITELSTEKVISFVVLLAVIPVHQIRLLKRKSTQDLLLYTHSHDHTLLAVLASQPPPQPVPFVALVILPLLSTVILAFV